MDCCFGTVVGPAEEHHLSGVAVGFEVVLQIKLCAAGLGKDECFFLGTRNRHLLETNLQCTQQASAFWCRCRYLRASLARSVQQYLFHLGVACDLWLVTDLSVLFIRTIQFQDLIEQVALRCLPR
jgi:hypothetical protein